MAVSGARGRPPVDLDRMVDVLVRLSVLAAAHPDLPEVGLGIVPSSGGLTRLVRMLGTARTRELVLLGTRIPATDAHRLGLITEVSPTGAALNRALALADHLGTQPSLAVTTAKQAIDAVADSSSAAALLIERLAYERGLRSRSPRVS